MFLSTVFSLARACRYRYDISHVTCHDATRRHAVQARAGEITNMTGIGSPYEAPVNPELVLSAEGCSIDDCAEKLLTYLRDGGYLKPEVITKTGDDAPGAAPPLSEC